LAFALYVGSSVSDLLPTYSTIILLNLYLHQNNIKPFPVEGYTDKYITTATIKGWKHLLKPDKYKVIVTDSSYIRNHEKNTVCCTGIRFSLVFVCSGDVSKHPHRSLSGLKQENKAYYSLGNYLIYTEATDMEFFAKNVQKLKKNMPNRNRRRSTNRRCYNKTTWLSDGRKQINPICFLIPPII